ncbi:DUF6199 family natural product biosynthesis protein [Paenibacillus sp. p3-SID867]|uniref:DUF6199 family natural product biosynthesis protein n=1 Tax=Paenibacillus sp. p3-SID867 TaxID=2916363 RepID=UPI0037CA1EB8
MLAVVFLVRGVLRIRKPTWGSLYRIWKVKYDSEPSSDYIQHIKSSGLLLLVLGSILFVAGILIVLL